ncbi:nuclear pore protein-like protein [Colletotrichum truncatum]|uniref:Nuclear pore protein-like protein n=1 Tax=Colletotrichum truncatum TaxID=5467 RepID=A0ACC3YCJ2_COLTU
MENGIFPTELGSDVLVFSIKALPICLGYKGTAVRSTRRLKVTVEACRPPRIFPSSVPPSDASTIYFLPKFNDGYLTICPGPFNDSNHSITPLEMSPKKTQSGIFAPSELLGRIERTITIGNGSNNVTIVTECRQNGKSVLHALLVSSDAMARASQVWRRMFEGEWVEACKDERPVLDYREDSHTAVMTLMNIIHIQFGQVPSTLTLSELREIAIFSDKWFLTAVFEPWVQGWVEQLSLLIDIEGREPDWLWIAWEFGITAVFNRVGERLAFGAPIPETKPASSAFTSPGGAFGVSRPQVSYLNELSKVSTVSSFSSMALPPGVEVWVIDSRPAQLRTRLLDIKLSDCENNDFKQTRRDGRHSSKQAKVYCGDFGKISKRIEDVPFQQPPFANDMQLNHLTDRFAIEFQAPDEMGRRRMM